MPQQRYSTSQVEVDFQVYSLNIINQPSTQNTSFLYLYILLTSVCVFDIVLLKLDFKNINNFEFKYMSSKKCMSIHELTTNKQLSSSSKVSPLQNIHRTHNFLIRKQNLVKKWDEQLTEIYTIDKKLGEGTFGEVYLVIHNQLQIKRALKVIMKSIKAHSNSHDELELLKKLDHPNILKIFEYYESESRWYIITQYFEGRELFDEIINEGRISQNIAAKILYEIIKALAYIHSNKIAHRDIKAENILIKKVQGKYVVKVIDWGLGTLVSTQMNRKCGTPEYCAPEVLKGTYNLQCDMWSLGVLAYIMLSGYMPFKAENIHQTLELVKKGHISWERKVWKTISMQAKQLIIGLMEKSVHKRLTATQCLKNSWILQHVTTQIDDVVEAELIDTLIRIKQFNAENKFQVIVINYIVNFIEEPIQQQKLKKEFEMIDENGDGQLSFQQLEKAYTKIYGVQARAIVEQIFTNIDLDGSGKISYSQFITFASKINRQFTTQQLKEAFKLFDSDKDGLIDRKEISHLIQYDKRTKSSDFSDILSEIDLNNDGKIDFQEFIDHIHKAVEKVRTRSMHSEQKVSMASSEIEDDNKISMANSEIESDHHSINIDKHQIKSDGNEDRKSKQQKDSKDENSQNNNPFNKCEVAKKTEEQIKQSG